MPMDAGIVLLGTSLPVKILMSCFSLPEGYLVGMMRTKVLGKPSMALLMASIAFGLLSSIAMRVNFGSLMCCSI